jgi:hypothetical protein
MTSQNSRKQVKALGILDFIGPKPKTLFQRNGIPDHFNGITWS